MRSQRGHEIHIDGYVGDTLVLRKAQIRNTLSVKIPDIASDHALTKSKKSTEEWRNLIGKWLNIPKLSRLEALVQWAIPEKDMARG